MYLKEIAIWGGLLLLLLLGVALTLLWLVDGRTMKKMLQWHVRVPQLPGKLVLPVLGAMLVGALAMAGCLVLSLPHKMFWPLAIVLFICLLMSTPRAMQTYWRSLRHTEPHRRYLLANGASHVESLIPSVRRAFRAAVLPVLCQHSPAIFLGMVMLFLGLVMGGVTIMAALASVVMLWAALFAASVLTAVLAMWLADRSLFDRHERMKNQQAGKAH